MMVESCTPKETPPGEGLDKDQEKQLRTKRRSTRTEEENWKEIYRILFPADSTELMPSPCKSFDRISIRAANLRGDYEELEQLVEYERYLARELPVLVRARLEASILGATGPIESQLLSQIGDMLRNCQADLYRTYTTGVQPLSETAANDPATEPSSSLPPQVEPAAQPAESLPVPDIPAFFAPPLLSFDDDSYIRELFSDPIEPTCTVQESFYFSDSGFNSMITGSDLFSDLLEGHAEESRRQFLALDAFLSEPLADVGPDEDRAKVESCPQAMDKKSGRPL
jgi:hypothetical protein